MTFRNNWNGCQVWLTTHTELSINPIASESEETWDSYTMGLEFGRAKVVRWSDEKTKLVSGNTVARYEPNNARNRGATVLESSTRPCLHGSITRPKSTALLKTVIPWHPFRGFLFQKHFVSSNPNVLSSGRFTKPVIPYCKFGRRRQGRNGCLEEVTTVFITSMTPRKNTCRFRT